MSRDYTRQFYLGKYDSSSEKVTFFHVTDWSNVSIVSFYRNALGTCNLYYPGKRKPHEHSIYFTKGKLYSGNQVYLGRWY